MSCFLKIYHIYGNSGQKLKDKNENILIHSLRQIQNRFKIMQSQVDNEFDYVCVASKNSN